MTPTVTARRNLSQRINVMLRKVASGELKPTDWQADQLQRALEQLEAERFAEGERTMAKAERPDLYEPAGYVADDKTDLDWLTDRLAEIVAGG